MDSDIPLHANSKRIYTVEELDIPCQIFNSFIGLTASKTFVISVKLGVGLFKKGATIRKALLRALR